MYYRNASCAIVVYDQTSMASFVRAQDWYFKTVLSIISTRYSQLVPFRVKQLSMVNNPDIVVALAANKMDVADREFEWS